MSNLVMSASDIVVRSNQGSFHVPDAVLIEHDLSPQKIGELITESWRTDLKKNHANNIRVTYYYWSMHNLHVFSWKPHIEGRTSW